MFDRDFYVELFRTWHQSDKQYGIDQEQDIHPGLAIAIVLMEDENVHEIEPDGRISWCRDASCPCRDQGV